MTSTQAQSAPEPVGYRPSGLRAGPALIATAAVHVGIAALLIAIPAVKQIEKIIWVPLPTKSYPADPPPAENPPERLPRTDTADPAKTVRDDAVVTTTPIFASFPTGTDIILPPPIDLGPAGGNDDALKPPLPVVTAAQLDRRFMPQFQPDYPPAMLRLNKEGTATVRVTIAADGRVTDVALVRADDPAFFEATRKQALRHWRFLPARRDGVPITSERELTVRFTLVD